MAKQDRLTTGGAEFFPAYQPSLFIGREEEINQVKTLLNQSEPRVKVLNIHADPGAGATFFLTHLYETVLPEILTEKGGTRFLFSFGSGQVSDAKGFVDIVNRYLGVELPPNPTLSEKIDSARHFMDVRPDERFVFLVDDYNANWELAEAMEKYVLCNWLVLRNVFFIVTEQGWSYPDKNSYMIEAARLQLGGFNPEETAEQLARQFPEGGLSPEKVFALGQGNPRNNLLLVQNNTPDSALAFTYEALVKGLPDDAKTALRIISVVGGGDGKLLASSGMDVSAAANAIWELNQRRLIGSWGNGAHQVAKSLAAIVDKHLMYSEPYSWGRIHREAADFFQKEAAKPENHRFKRFFMDAAAKQGQAFRRYHCLFEAQDGEEFCLKIGFWLGRVKALSAGKFLVLTELDRDMPRVLDLGEAVVDWFTDPQVEIIPE